jgi:CubicO group peptidase (beta-lactamase class C family)
MKKLLSFIRALPILGMAAAFTVNASAQTPPEKAMVPKVVPVTPRQRLTPETLPQFLEAVRAAHHLPAIGVAIVFKGKISVFTTGVRKMGDPTPVTDEDYWALGSCTKSMTAVLMATFVDSGILKWESTLSEMLPDLAETMRPEYREVTLRQLLSHRAGFPTAVVPLDRSWTTGDGWAKWIARTDPVTQQRTEYVKWFLTHAPKYPPGTKVTYSNVGYVTAGAIAERLTGKSWEELIRERVFEPLGMKSVTFGTQNTEKPLQPWPHFERDGQAIAASADPNAPGHSIAHPSMEFPMVSGPYGTVRCSLQDWAKYAQFWLDGMNGQGDLVRPESLQFLATPPDDMLAEGIKTPRGYACGWMIYKRPWSQGKLLVHSGTNSKNNSLIWLAPKEKFAVMIVTNRDEADDAMDNVAAPLVMELSRLSK